MLKKFHIASFVCCIVSSFWPFLLQNTKVATHFGLNGQADGWMRPGISVGMMCLIASLLFGLLSGTGWMVRRLPAWSINLPNKAYWLLPANREKAAAILKPALQLFMIVFFLFLTCMNGLVFLANLNGNGLNLVAFFSLEAALLLFVLVWAFRLRTLFKVPDHG